MKGCDVGEPHDRLVRAALQLLQKSHCSVTAAGAEHCTHGRIGECSAQLRKPPLVIARKVAVSVKDFGLEVRAIAICDEVETCLE
jgi:hypothetical protein